MAKPRSRPAPTQPETTAAKAAEPSIAEKFQQVLRAVETGALSLYELDLLRDGLNQWSRRLSVDGIDLRQKPKNSGDPSHGEADRCGSGAPWGRHKAAPSNPATFARPEFGSAMPVANRLAKAETFAERQSRDEATRKFPHPDEAEAALRAGQEWDALRAGGPNFHMQTTRERYVELAVERHRAEQDAKIRKARGE